MWSGLNMCKIDFKSKRWILLIVTFILSLGISTPANSEPCLEKEKTNCTIEPLDDSEQQFLVRTTPIYKETYQSQLVTCSSAQPDNESHHKNFESRKIYTYSAWFPISDNIHSYIVDIVGVDTLKQAVRFFIKVPRKSNSLSPIVVVTLYQDRAAFAVFEQTNQSNIDHYYSLIECSKETTKDQLGLMNWQLSECININNSIQYNHKMKPGTFETFPLNEGQDYQIWIDSENGRTRDPAFKTPVFGRPDKDVSLQIISAFITGKDSGIETDSAYQVSCFHICRSKTITTQEKGHETEKEANSSTVDSKFTQVSADQYYQLSDTISRSPSTFERTRITEEHCDSCAPLLNSVSFTFQDHQEHASQISSHNSGPPLPWYHCHGLFHPQKQDQIQNYTQALNNDMKTSFQTSRFRISPQKAWNSMETILEDSKDLYSSSGFLNTESVPKSSCLFSAFVIAPLALNDENLSVQDLEEEFRMINDHYHKVTKTKTHKLLK